MSGARQRAVVSPFVTRGPPIRREKAAVKGAMNSIWALVRDDETSRLSSIGGHAKRSVDETYSAEAAITCAHCLAEVAPRRRRRSPRAWRTAR